MQNSKHTKVRPLRILSLAFGLTSLMSFQLNAAPIDLNTPDGATIASRKIQCSTVDDKPVFFSWDGKLFSRRMGEPDQHLFDVEGYSVRACATVDGGKKGKSFKLVTREILLYKDKKTGKPLKTWLNPWTNEEVDVFQVLNDPVNQPVRFNRDENGKVLPYAAKFMAKQQDDRWWLTLPVPLFYHNPLAGDYQKQVGGVYHATELFNFLGDIDSLVDEKTDTADVQVGWVRISDWLPFMMMSGREGGIYIHAAGRKLDKFDDVSDSMKAFIAAEAPKYSVPPPTNDTRPNDTSWTTYKKDVPGAPFVSPTSH